MRSLSILVVDDHEAVRQGIRALLSPHDGWFVCGEAGDGVEAIAEAKRLRPDVVLMDISMPRMQGIEATRIIRREVPESDVIIVSQNNTRQMHKAALEAGAKGFVDKSKISQELLRTIEGLAKNGAESGLGEQLDATTDTHLPAKFGNDRGKELVAGDSLEERERQERERAGNLLAAIVDSSDDAIVSKTLDGVITSWNRAAERLFGYTREEAVGQHITLIVPEDRRDEEVGILERLKRGERIDHFETLRRCKDGSLLALSLTISPVKDDAGRIVGASKVARDVTQRKEIERALAERARLLDLSNDTIMVRDGLDRVTYWNQSACELYGYSREEAIGRVTHELLRTEFPEPLEQINEQLQRDGRWAGELIHTCKDTTRIVVASRWVLDKDDRGNRKRVLETNNDITQQKQSDRALRESEERLRALSNSLEAQVRERTEQLECRNAEVLQQSQQLRELSNRLLKTQDDERRHIARELHDSAGQLIAALGMNLAEIKRLANGNPLLAETLEDTQNLVQQLNKEIRTTTYLLHPPLLDENGLPQAIQWYMRGLMERSGLRIELDIAEDFGRLPADLELAVFRIVQESLTNIHRHSRSKTATIRLSRGLDNVLLEIQDQGTGISGEKLAAIKAQRTGVGITGMRERVRHLKGEMDIQSSSTGATIMVTFPLPRAAATGTETTLQPSEAFD